MNIEKPDTRNLATFLEANRNGVSDAEFVTRYLSGAYQSLKGETKLYRSFGAWWWPLKRLLLQLDDYAGEFGYSYNTELNEALSYENDALTACAAYLEQQDNLERGYAYANTFFYETAELEPIEIVIEDDAMEARVLAESFL